jgi:hypothetical protein
MYFGSTKTKRKTKMILVFNKVFGKGSHLLATLQRQQRK